MIARPALVEPVKLIFLQDLCEYIDEFYKYQGKQRKRTGSAYEMTIRRQCRPAQK